MNHLRDGAEVRQLLGEIPRRPSAERVARISSGAPALRPMRPAANLPVPLVRRGRWFSWTKRAYDVIVAMVALVLLAPLFAALALAIKLSSPGPVFFRQDRYGRGGRLFSIYKFRTMDMEDCDRSGVAQTVENDPRVSRVGRILRKTSFDELPQLINILKGEMSVVGPRPHVPGMLAAGVPYEEFDPRYMTRHVVRPGLTGLAQVNGYRGETRTEHSARMRLNYDLEYISRQSISLDIRITLLTFWREFIRGTGY